MLEYTNCHSALKGDAQKMTGLDVSNAPLRSHGDVICDFLDLKGKHVVDVGCGAGRLTRTMTQMGATVVGIDPGTRQLEKARAAETIGSERFIEATAEELPVDDQSVDVVVFFNSLHHVPMEGMQQALVESRRVLRDGGALYIAEPMAQGPKFEMAKPFNDETVVRAEAYRVIKSAGAIGFREQHETVYTTDISYTDFESFRESSTSIDPVREAYFRAHDEELRQRFEDYAVKRPDGWHFPQFIRVNVLTPV
jgi:2-polyprenyl-3-methyl-5-hydroxy-6-metoxy-1,4-benzoquinol methylase